MPANPPGYPDAEKALWSTFGITPIERRVRLPTGNEVRLQEIGEGPPVLFVHGAAVAGTSWALLANALKNDVRCLLIDRPGCGLSDPVPNGPLRTPAAYKDFAERLIPDLLDGLGLEAAPVACTSMGGFFGFRAAIAKPERISRLVAFSWPMGTPMASVPLMMRLGSPAPIKKIMSHLPITASAVKMMLKQVGMQRAVETGSFDDDMVAWLVALLKHTETFKSEADNNTFISLRGENPEFLFTDEELQRLRIPVLLLWGEEDTNGGRPQAEAFAARLPNVTLDVIERAGHAPWVDELDHCAERASAFLSNPGCGTDS